MLSQVGAALKGAPATMGGFKVEGIFMTTQGGDLVTYMNAMHSHAKLANGKPVYDGYLSRNPGNVGRVNQCAPAPAAGDPRNGFKKLGVPIIAVVAQGEVVATRGLRRADSDDPADRFRLYEVAGVGHIDKAAYSQFPLVADQIAAEGATQGTPDWPLNVTCDPPIQLTEQPALAYVYDAAGNRTTSVGTGGQTTSYVYDQLNRNTAITLPDIAAPPPTTTADLVMESCCAFPTAMRVGW
jgi:YD repeat-containing protein